MSVVNGSDLYMWINDVLIGYSTSYTISIEDSPRRITNKGSGHYHTYTPGIFDVSASCDGLLVYDSGAEQIYAAMIARTAVKLDFGEKSIGTLVLDTAVRYYTGYFIVTSFEENATDAENSTYSATFKPTADFDSGVITPEWEIPVAGVYYVKNGGSDAADGLTDATAWETLTKVNAFAFAAGNKVSFKRGDTFRGSIYRTAFNGSSGSQITFSAYGTGAKPKILGAKDLSATGDWENDAGNVWKTTATLGTLQDDISNLVFNNEASCGVKVIAIGDVDTQGYFFYNTADNLVYIYSVGNPATFYTHIEACGHHDINQALVMFNDCDYITVEYLDVRYSSAAGIEFKNANYGIIQHNEVSWIGGEYLDPETDATRLGNGISTTLTSSNIIIRYNKATQCFDAGISPQGWGTFTLQDISIYYNISITAITHTRYGHQQQAHTSMSTSITIPV